jgi:hypothetical protein
VAVTNGYCTVAELREHLGDDRQALNEALLERAINASSRAIDLWTGRRFWLDGTVTARSYRPDLTDVAWVDDIGSTTGLVIATDTTGDGSWATTWATTDYQLEPLNAAVSGTGYAWWTIGAIDRYTFPVAARRPTLRVTALHGWSAVPDGVAEACLLKAASLFKRKDAPFGVAGFGEFGAVRITRRDGDVIELLHPYVRLGVGAV